MEIVADIELQAFLLNTGGCVSVQKSRAVVPGISNAGSVHASSSSFQLLDAVQHRFLLALGVSELDAFLQFSLDPLAVRRDIAILGLIHRTALGKGPGVFKQFFPLDPSPPVRPRFLRSASASSRRHSRHLVDPVATCSPEYVTRSALCVCTIYFQTASLSSVR